MKCLFPEITFWIGSLLGNGTLVSMSFSITAAAILARLFVPDLISFALTMGSRAGSQLTRITSDSLGGTGTNQIRRQHVS
jgi:hypothetical protein